MSDTELMQIADIIQSFYDDAIFEHNLQTLSDPKKQPTFEGDCMTIKDRGFIALCLIEKLTKEIHDREICKDKDCMSRIKNQFDTFFKKEVEMKDWWVKRVSSLFHQIQVAHIQSNSSVLKIRADVPTREQGEGIQ